jgi:hypothetical protein
MLDFLFRGSKNCLSGSCKRPIHGGGIYCESCQKYVDSLYSGSSEDRERAYLKGNIKEWKALMEKYPDIT